MHCSRCQFDNPPRMKFCGQCGISLAPICSQCGQENPPGFQFCGQCGAPIASSSATPSPAIAPPASASPATDSPAPASPATAPRAVPPPVSGTPPGEQEGEQRPVTVLSCDLHIRRRTESTEPLGPELTHRFLNRFLSLAQAEVERYGGRVRRLRPRGLVALFGAPMAQEDHPNRGVLAALAIAEKVEAGRGELHAEQLDWTVCTGLACGPVIFGGESQLAVGEAPRLAALMLKHAGDGEILAPASFQRLVEARYEWTAWSAEGDAEDGPEAERIFHLTGARERSTMRPLSLAGSEHSPFIGRRHELAMLEDAWREVEAGRGQIVGLSGEPGNGKSRLVFELRQRLAGEALTSFRGYCLSYGTDIPYLPLLHLLRAAAGVEIGEPSAAVRGKLDALLAEHGLADATALPYFHRLLDVSNGDGDLEGVDPQTLQQGTRERLRQFFVTASRQRPVVIEIEDLHWIDESSEEFLASLIEVLSRARILILLTYRSGYQPGWMGRSYATQIPVRPLSSDESHSLVAGILNDRQDVVATGILERAQGNPFFLEELAWSLREHGEGELDAPLPDTIRGLLMARIDRLPAEHKRLLQTASVLDREFPRRLLHELWQGEGEVAQLIGDLQRWELLQDSPAADSPNLLFRHSLTQDVAYASLLSEARARLHLRAAQALEELHVERLEEVVHRLAYHYTRAGDIEKTVSYLSLAAHKAAGVYAHAEAARELREALIHAQDLPAESDAALAEKDRTLVTLCLRLAESLLPQAALRETLDQLQAQEERVEALADPALLGRYHFWLAHTHSYLGDAAAAVRHARASLEAATAAGDEATRGRAHYLLGRQAFWGGEYVQGLEDSLQAVVLLERSGEPWWQGQAYWVAAYHHHALGQFREAFDSLARAASIGEALDDPRLDCSWSAGYFHASLGDWETGIAESQAGFERARDPLNTAASLGFLGCGYLEKGDLSEAVEALREAAGRFEETGLLQLRAWFTAYLAEALSRAGELAEARQRADEALAVSREAGFPYGEGLALRSLGRMALAGGDAAGAGEHFAAALATFERLEMPLEQAWSHLDLAELDQAAGGGVAAGAAAGTDHLGQAQRLFHELELTQQAKAAAERVGRAAGEG